MMTDDEAFARLGEVMAEVGKPWPRDYVLRGVLPRGINLGIYVYGLTPRI